MGTNYTGGSIVDYLNSVGQGSSYAERARMAAQYGIQNYQGSSSQNAQLLGLLRNSNSGAQPTQNNIPEDVDSFGLQAAIQRETEGNSDPSDARNLEYARSRGWILAQGTQGLQSQAAMEKTYDDAKAANLEIQKATEGGSSMEEIIHALETGNFSGILDFNGQPFSAAEQEKARVDAEKANSLYYEQLQSKETADAEKNLAQSQADYQDYLINSGQAFEADKSKSDQQSANQGVLFSGSRVQKEKNLQRAYEQDEAYTRDKMSRNIGTTAQDYQYKYGNDNASGLSQYYKLGGNTYNPNTARNGVGSSGLSSIYNPSDYSYDGTRNTERSANTQTRAAGYLWNKGNKLLSTSYNNQL